MWYGQGNTATALQHKVPRVKGSYSSYREKSPFPPTALPLEYRQQKQMNKFSGKGLSVDISHLNVMNMTIKKR